MLLSQKFNFILSELMLTLVSSSWNGLITNQFTSQQIVGQRIFLITFKRWDGKAKEACYGWLPRYCKKYNSVMGGVDLVDMLISLYRTPYKTRRWYLRVVVRLLNICKVNSWLLYRRYATQLKIPVRRQMKLGEFANKIANALIYR